MKIYILILFVILSSCLTFEKGEKVKESLLSFSYVPLDHAIHGGKSYYDILIENLTSDTIIWRKRGYIDNHIEFPLGKEIEILPEEKVVKSFVFFLDREVLRTVNDNIIPVLYLKEHNVNIIINKHEDFSICNRVDEPTCYQKSIKLNDYRYFGESH